MILTIGSSRPAPRGVVALIAALCAALQSGCASTSDQTLGAAPSATDFVLRPGNPGDPLPAQTTAAGRHWPVEVREGIERVVMFLDAARGQRIHTFDNAAIEKLLDVKLHGDTKLTSHIGATPYGISGWLTNYQASGASFSGQANRYRPSSALGDYVYIRLKISPKKYCLDPYDLAVYIGGDYLPLHPAPSLHRETPDLPKFEPAYAWGMFERGVTGIHYGSRKIHISIEERCVSEVAILHR
ncbi:hypothetical protein QTN24_21880 [Cupriavidus sp. SZY C1]|uniref:hypothetical protein n=1 Tax=Cupriavidus sp. SZY C1 TaxID=3055037 RepID=UPI0028B770D4|nr:hypothetical protein [Cupriavidus sp. SZY C1]MDT6964163.1 hypothetical protein [Cupriavidus sp. SZY C1]